MSKENKIIVVFRNDDCSSVSSTDWEAKLINAFQKRNLSCIFGIIPYISKRDAHDVFPLSSAKAKILKDGIKAGILEVALHGYSHQVGYKSLKGYSEFLNLDYETQLKKIKEGKTFLEEILDIQVATFIPPWNSYDLTTIQVLENSGFKCISADRYGYIKKSSSLKFLPGTCGFSELREVVKTARKVINFEPIVIVAVIHDYSFLEYSRRGRFKFQDLVEILDWVTSQNDIQVCSFDQVLRSIKHLDEAPYLNQKLLLPPLMPKFLGKLLFSRFILPDSIRGARIRCWIFMLFFYFIVISVAAMVISFVFR